MELIFSGQLISGGFTSGLVSGPGLLLTNGRAIGNGFAAAAFAEGQIRLLARRAGGDTDDLGPLRRCLRGTMIAVGAVHVSAVRGTAMRVPMAAMAAVRMSAVAVRGHDDRGRGRDHDRDRDHGRDRGRDCNRVHARGLHGCVRVNGRRGCARANAHVRFHDRGRGRGRGCIRVRVRGPVAAGAPSTLGTSRPWRP